MPCAPLQLHGAGLWLTPVLCSTTESNAIDTESSAWPTRVISPPREPQEGCEVLCCASELWRAVGRTGPKPLCLPPAPASPGPQGVTHSDLMRIKQCPSNCNPGTRLQTLRYVVSFSFCGRKERRNPSSSPASSQSMAYVAAPLTLLHTLFHSRTLPTGVVLGGNVYIYTLWYFK